MADRFTPEEYQAAGQWIFANLENPKIIKDKAKELGLTNEELTRAVQTVNPAITLQDVITYLDSISTPSTPYSIKTAADVSKLPSGDLQVVRDYVSNLYTANGAGIDANEAKQLQDTAAELGIDPSMVSAVINAAYKGYGDYSIEDIDKLISGTGVTLESLAGTDTDTDTITGGTTTDTITGGTTTDITTKPATYKRADGTTITLPSGWSTYSPAQKASWMNTNQISKADFLANFTQADLDYWISQGFIPYVPTLTTTTTTDTTTGGTTTDTITGGTTTDTITGGTTTDTTTKLDEGDTGVIVTGESGLREGYAPYVQDYLQRISALLARRDVDPKTGEPVYTGPQFGGTGAGGYGTNTFNTLQSLQTQRENMMGMGTGAGATPAYQPYQYSFANMTPPVKAAKGGIMSLGVEKFAEGDLVGGVTGQTVPSTFTAPTGGYQQATYSPDSMNYVAPGTYQAGTIGSTFDQTKAGAYTSPVPGKEIASTYTTPTDLYSAGTIGTDFSGIKELGYTGPAAGEEISSTFTTPTNIYSAGTIGAKFDPVTQSYTGPGTGISTNTFDADAMKRLMNPYMSGVVNPQLDEARRQAEITRQAQASRMAQVGAFGGSRQAIMESELARNLGTQLGTIYGTGQKEAYDAALRAFEAEQGRKLQASTATEAARQEAGRQGLSEAQTRAQLGLQGQIAQEQAKQAAGQQSLTAATTAAQLGLQGQTAQEAAKQAAGQQALSAAQTAAELGLRGQTAQEAAKQAAGQQALTAAQTEAQLALQGQTAQEQAKQAAGQQAISAAQIAAQLGLQGAQLGEQSRQFAAKYGLDVATTSAQYDQQARQLQQQAEEAEARGDQFAATLALNQLQEAQRAAEAAREFEYKQARDTYLDPFRELMYANQALTGLPIKAGDVGDSSALQALLAGAATNNLLTSSTGTSSTNTGTTSTNTGTTSANAQSVLNALSSKTPAVVPVGSPTSGLVTSNNLQKTTRSYDGKPIYSDGKGGFYTPTGQTNMNGDPVYSRYYFDAPN